MKAEGIGRLPGWVADSRYRKDLLYHGVLAFQLALILHLLLFLLVPHDIFVVSSSEDWEAYERELTVEYMQPDPVRFVEANPAVPQNVPDETPNEAARDQQAAQPDPDELSKSEFPEIEGEVEDSQKIVDGSLEEASVEPLPPGLYSTETGAGSDAKTMEESNAEQAMATALPPPPDFIQQEAVNEEGPGSSVEVIGEAEKEEEKTDKRVVHLTRGQLVEVVHEEVSEQQAMEAAQKGMPVPQPRPKLKFQVPPGPRMTNVGRASRLGQVVAVDAKYSEFGDYLQRLVEAVDSQWKLLARNSTLAEGNSGGAKVKLKFMLDSEGYIGEMEVIQSTATRGGSVLCRDAVESRAPYGKWPEQMIVNHGHQVPLTFIFHYY